MAEQNQEVLLRVEHLCQYFGPTKAVDDVSFDVKKGEVFGLVGESGCGKTTTGRSIIKLYNITSGSIYFKGQRIAAGLKSYRDEIRRLNAEIRALNASKAANAAEQISAKQARIAEIRLEMKKARFDHEHTDSEYAKKLRQEIIAKYEPLLAEAKADKTQPDAEKIAALKQQMKQETDAEIAKLKGDNAKADKAKVRQVRKEIAEKYAPMLVEARGGKAKLAALKKMMDEELRIAKKTKLVTQIQMIFQDPIASLDPRMTVREIIAEGLMIRGIKDQKYIDEKVFEILEMVGLVREHASRYPHEFSGGQRQRIGIARAVIMNPELLIADEPVSALDVSIQAQVINLLNELREKLGLTILFVAHDLSVVKYFSDRIGVMYYGHMVELATSDELFAHPLHPYTRSLLSAIPLPDPNSEKNRVRIQYNSLAEHDYSVDKPSLREILPGHFVRCNDAEEQKYKKELGLL